MQHACLRETVSTSSQGITLATLFRSWT